MANTAFNHDPALTVAASNTTAGAAVKWVASKNLGESLIILDSGGNGRIGIAGDLDLITLTANTVTIAGSLTLGSQNLTAANLTDLVDGGATSLHSHAGGGPSQATQSAIEAETNEDTYLPPDLVKNSPGVAKAFCVIEGVGSLQAGSYNVASITDTGTGDSTVVIDTDFSGSAYTVASNSYDKDVTAFNVVCNTFAAGSVRNATYNCESNALQDTQRGWIAYGDQ